MPASVSSTAAPASAPAAPRRAGPAAGRPGPAPAALVALALGLVYVIWGSTYLGIRVALDDLPPYTLGSVRFLVAGTLMTLVVLPRVERGARPAPRQWLAAAIVGILLLGVGNGGVAIAEQYVPSGLVALVIATVPLWMALIARVALGARLSRLAALSLLVGFAGVGILAAPGGSVATTTLILVLVSPIAWSLGSVYARRAPLPRPPLVAVGIEMLAAGVALAIPAVATGELGRLHGDALGPRPLLALAYLVVFGSFVGYSAYAWLLQVAPLPLVSTYAYVNPVVAVALGALLLGEAVTTRILVGGAVIALAVGLVLARPSGSAGRRPAPACPPEAVAASEADDRPADGRLAR